MVVWAGVALFLGPGWRPLLVRVWWAVLAPGQSSGYRGEVNAAGLPHGEGTMFWRDGRRYRGGWCDGLPHKRGSMQWADGMAYAGSWWHGAPSGLGVATMPDGRACHVYRKRIRRAAQ